MPLALDKIRSHVFSGFGKQVPYTNATDIGPETDAAARSRPSNHPAPSAPGLNRSVSRALDILLEIARNTKPLSFAELQKRLKVPKATLHKLLFTLENRGFLSRNEDSGRYSIGMAALEVTAGQSLRTSPVRSVLDPIIQKLVETWNETCYLSVLEEGYEIIINRLDPPNQHVRTFSAVGQRHVAYAGASGLAALAQLPDDQALKDLPANLETFTKNSIKTRDELRARLQAVRENGYALDLEEAYPGVCCVAAAVAVVSRPVVSISFTLPLQRAPMERLHALAEPLMAAAREAEQSLALTPFD